MYTFTNTDKRYCENEDVLKALKKLEALKESFEVSVAVGDANKSEGNFVCVIKSGAIVKRSSGKAPYMAVRNAVNDALDTLRGAKDKTITKRRDATRKAQDAQRYAVNKENDDGLKL